MSDQRKLTASDKKQLVRDGKMGCAKCCKCFQEMCHIRDEMKEIGKSREEILAELSKRFYNNTLIQV